MPAVRHRKTDHKLRNLGLLASASITSLIIAGEAQAACTPSPAQPLNNITQAGSNVQCTGANSGQTININTGNTTIYVVAAGATLDNSTVTIAGNDDVLAIGAGRSAANLVYSAIGINNSLEIEGSATNLSVTANGQNNGISIVPGGTVTATPGNIVLTAAAGQTQRFLLQQGGSLASTGNAGAAYLLTGGTGNQIFEISGTVAVQGNGLFINAGDGNDLIFVDSTAVFANSNISHTLNGGAGTDRLYLYGSGNAPLFATGIELLDVDAGTGGTRTISENGSYAEVNLLGGTLSARRVQALGLANSLVTLSNGTVLTLDFTAPTIVTNSFSGTGTILHNTLDPVTYGGSSGGFSGVFNILGGTAFVTSSDAFGTGSIVNSGTLSFGGLNLANTISGTGQVIVTGSGNARLSGNNTFSGGLDIQGGVLDVSSVNSLGTGIVTSSTAGAVLAVGNASDQVLANNLTGNLALVKADAGVLDLTGTNSYALGTLINGGAVRVDGFARLGTGQVIANAGGSLILDYNGAGQLLQTTPFMTGGGSFIKEGSGDVVMNQTSTFTGGTTIRAGRIGLNNGDALGSGGIQVNAGAELGIGGVTLANSVSGSGAIVKTANNQATLSGDNSAFTGLFDVQDGGIELTDGRAAGSGDLAIASGSFVFVSSTVGDTTIAADISGAGDLENFSNTRLTLNGNNSLSGVVFVSNGTLQIEGSQNVGTANINIVGSAARLELNTAGSTTLSNSLAGNGSVVKTGPGTVFITGTNSYTGGTDIQQGAIRVTDVSFLGSGAIAVQAGAALDLSIAGAQTLNQSISGAGILRKSDLGDLTLLGNSLTGGVDIVGGRVIVNTAAALGSGPVTTAADTQLVFDNAATEGISNQISGAGAFTKDGTGLLAVNNANSYTGGTLINGGRLVANASGAFGTGTVIVMQNAEIGLGGVTLSNAITGAGRVIKTANNTGSLTGNNAYSGGTDIQQGTLLVNSPSALGSGGVAIGSGAFLNIAYGGSSNTVLNNLLSGSGALVKDGSGTVVVNASNTFSGGTAINAGRIGLNFGDGLGTGGVTINSGAELGIGNVAVANALTGTGRVVKTASGTGTLSGSNSFSGGIDIQGGNLFVASVASLGTGAIGAAAGTTLTVGNSASQTLAHALTGAGGLVKSGSGDLTVTGNAFTGGTAITGGRLLATGGVTGIGSGAVAISSGAELVYTAASNATFANGISGAGTLRKLGAGQLLFSNPFAIGALAVDAGSVRLNANLTGNASVASTGRLDGTGRVIGNLTNNGTVAPGNSIGTLTVQGNYVHNAGSVLEIEFDGAGAIDLLAVTGSATLNGGTLRFISTTGAEGSGGTFLTAAGGLTGTFSTVETVGAALPLAVIYQPGSAIMAPSVLTARPSTFNAQSFAAADSALGFIGSIGVADLRRPQGNRMWMAGFGSWGDRSASASTLAYKHDTRGLAGGVNFAAGDAVTLGAAFGWAKGDIALGSNGGGGDQSSLLGSVHARYSGTGFTLGGGVLFGKVDQETLRNVSFNGFSASVNGETESKVFGAFAEIGLPLGSAAGWAFSANARGSYIRQVQQAYTESGTSPLRLAVGELKTGTLEGQAMLTAKTSLWDRSNGGEESPEGIDLRIDLGTRYLGTLGDRLIPVTFAASNAGVVLQGDTRGTLQGTAGLGLDYTTRGGATFSLGYKGEFGRTDRHGVQAGISFAF